METTKEIRDYQARCLKKLEEFRKLNLTSYYSIGDFIMNLISGCNLSLSLESDLGIEEVNSKLTRSLKIVKTNS